MISVSDFYNSSKSETLEKRLDEALNRLGKIEDRISRLNDEFKRFKQAFLTEKRT